MNPVFRSRRTVGSAPATRWTRRTFLGAGLAAIAFRASADEEDMRAAIEADFDAIMSKPGGIEITMPEFSDSGSSVPMEIYVPSTMTSRDYPRVVRVYAPRNPRPRVIALYFTPACGEARMSTRVRLSSFQDVVAVAEMSNGETFEAIRRVNVTYGACEDAIASDQFPPGWSPRTRVAAPEQVAAGEIFTVRTIINHPMETGLRRDMTGLLVPIRIAERFTCRANGQEVFGAELEPAVAANPFIEFNLRLEESADLDFEWIDTSGDRYEDAVRVEVV